MKLRMTNELMDLVLHDYINESYTQTLAVRRRWDSLVLQERIRGVISDLQQECKTLYSSDPFLSDVPLEERLTLGQFMCMFGDLGPATGTINEITVGEVLQNFKNKAGELGDKFKVMVTGIIDLITDLASKIKGDDFDEALKEEGVDDVGEATNKMTETIFGIKENLEEMWADYKKSKEDMPPKAAMGAAMQGDAGKGAVDNMKEFAGNPVVKLAAKTVAGELFKKFLGQIAEFVPFGKQIVAGAKLVTKGIGAFKKIRGFFKKAKKSAEPPEAKFADFAQSIARGKDKNMGEFANALQMNDDLEATLDDRLEIEYIKDYVEQLETAAASNPDMPIEDIDINKVIGTWVKEKQPDVDLAVDA
jgi:hypothetical protein